MGLTSSADTASLDLDHDIVVSHLGERDSHNGPILGLLEPKDHEEGLANWRRGEGAS